MEINNCRGVLIFNAYGKPDQIIILIFVVPIVIGRVETYVLLVISAMDIRNPRYFYTQPSIRGISGGEKVLLCPRSVISK